MIDSPTTGRNLMFEHSRVVETGPFDELLQAGALAELAKSQHLSA
jgi:ABC-type multidrug transport system fused ATPase/permease subunit